MKSLIYLTLSCSLYLCFSLKTQAQDTNYWTQQFGTESALLSGAVVGGTKDNTMLFYNPGALGFLDSSSISVNANAYSIENIKIANAIGNKADFKSSQLASIPLLAGGMINTKDDRWKIGYGFMAPVQFNFKGIARVDGDYDIIDNIESPGAEELIGESAISDKLSEVLIAFGAARKLNDNWSVGLTNMFTVRSQTYLRNFSSYVFLNDGNETTLSGKISQNVDYYNVRYAAKLGVSYQKDKWRAGLTLTTPSINIMGIGSVAEDVAAVNLKLIDDNRVSGVATDRQTELKSKFKSPLSVSAGVNYVGSRSHIGFSIQYYAAIDEYNIMNVANNTFVRPEELAPQLTSDEFMNVRAAAKSVVNVALGYEYKLKENLFLYLSARTDMSYFDKSLRDEPGIKTTISSWDIYHFATGFTLNRTQSSLSLGFLFSTGSTDNYLQEGSITDPNENTLLKGSRTITEASYNSFGILLGYTFHFKKF
ncbi:OmpP1/FadL family transporter [Formosa haliotis]|uniref:OmpP1/FadL family transporter n=1 Tax=Formosa haliotis TaxID=1555194 RepID=UPI001146DAD9|nr:hypothetical protein [Formosa haliotis]